MSVRERVLNLLQELKQATARELSDKLGIALYPTKKALQYWISKSKVTVLDDEGRKLFCAKLE